MRHATSDSHHRDLYDRASVRWLTLLSVCVATFLMPMSLSSVNVALPVIASDLRADAVLVSWVPTMNLLGAVAFQLPAGRIGDILGRKKIFMGGALLFAVSSLSVELINDIRPLLAIRLIQGVSGAMIFGTGMAIVSNVFANHNRGMALGITSAAVYLGLTCGPWIGGILTDVWGWRSVFLIPLPLATLALIMVGTFVHETERNPHERLDWIGSLIFMTATSSLFVGISWLPSWTGALLALFGAAAMALFVYQQERSSYPLIRLRHMIGNKVFFRSIQSSFLMYSANYPLQFMMSLYLQYIQGLTPSEAGKLMLLQAAVMAVVAPLSGRLSDRLEPRVPATLGCVFFMLGLAALATVDETTSQGFIAVLLLVMGLGMGLFTSPNNNAALSVVKPERLGVGSSILNISRAMGNMLGMAVVVLLFNVIIGNAQIEPDQYPLLMSVLRIAFIICAGYAALAAFTSWRRGAVRPA